MQLQYVEKKKYAPQVVHSIEYISRITYKDIFRQIKIESLPPVSTQEGISKWYSSGREKMIINGVSEMQEKEMMYKENGNQMDKSSGAK